MKKISTIASEYGEAKDLSDQSRINYEFIARHFEKEMKISDVNQVTGDSLVAWREKLKARGTSPNTWNCYLRHIGIILKYAVAKGYIKNPKDYTIHYAPVPFERPKTLSLDEIRKVVQFLESEDCPFKPHWLWSLLVRTLFYTGMRRTQICGLMWQDIDFEEGIIELRAKYSKTNRSWQIPLPSPVANDLLYLKELTLKQIGDALDFEDRFVFDVGLFNPRYKTEGKLEPQTVSNFFKRVGYATDIQISAHRLRHTMATELAAQGKYKELQMLLGHTNVRTTMKYIHPEMSRVKELIDTLSVTDI
ncbi:MAG: site-specific integrase [Acidiferrobacterales bacterium]|nr:site-specific integrase [Acidiferrobacterales bacterium]